MSLHHAIRSLGALRRAAAQADMGAVHDGITDLAILLAAEAEAAVAAVLMAIEAAYPAAPEGLRRTQVHALVAARLGERVADLALEGVPEDLGEMTLGEFENRLHRIML